jgi:HK97 family phage prohead protease
MEFKSIAVADIAITERKVIGYAAAFGNVDSANDIIKPGAFKKTLKENKSIKVFYNHMTPIGKPDVMREDGKGLYTESTISRTAKGDEILELIKDGVINTMSIGYQTIDFGQDNKTGIRTLKELKLYEFGPVDFAANEAAIITGVKAFTDRLASGQTVELKHLAAVRQELKALLSAIESATGEPGLPTPNAGPSLIDTRIMRLSEEHTARLAEAFRTKH